MYFHERGLPLNHNGQVNGRSVLSLFVSRCGVHGFVMTKSLQQGSCALPHKTVDALRFHLMVVAHQLPTSPVSGPWRQMICLCLLCILFVRTRGALSDHGQ